MFVPCVCACKFLKTIDLNVPKPALFADCKQITLTKIYQVTRSKPNLIGSSTGRNPLIRVKSKNLTASCDNKLARRRWVFSCPALFALPFWVTGSAYTNKVGRVIVKFVAVFVMYVQNLACFLKDSTARLASVIVAQSNLTCYALPSAGVVPLGNTTLPRGIVFSFDCAGKHKGFALLADWYAKVLEPTNYRRSANFKHIRNLARCSFVYHIFTLKPFFVFVKSVFVLMSNDIDVPTVFSLVPSRSITTPAFARRGGANGKVFDRFTHLPVFAPFLATARFYAVHLEDVVNRCLVKTKSLCDGLCASPSSIYGWSCIHLNNFFVNFWRITHVFPIWRRVIYG